MRSTKHMIVMLVATILSILLASSLTGWSQWNIETIEMSVGDAQMGISSYLVLDSGGNPHIVYGNQITSVIGHAWWDVDQWLFEANLLSGLRRITDLDVMNDDTLLACFTSDDGAGIACRLGDGTWSASVDEAQYYIRQSFLPDGSFPRHTAAALSVWKPGLKECRYLSSGCTMYNDDGYSVTAGKCNYDWGWGTYSYPNIALNMEGQSYLIYVREGSLYCKGHGIVDDSAIVGGTSSSIAVDPWGLPHVSYYDTTNGDLKYAWYDGTNWHNQVVDSAGDVGKHTSLAVDGQGHPHISYYDITHEDLKYAVYNGNSWDIEVVDSGGIVGKSSSLALDAQQQPHIAYFDTTNSVVKYATRREVLDQHVATGKVTRAYLGVYIQDITKAMEETFGVNAGEGMRVSDTISGSPAEQAGMKSGDVITKVNGEAVGSTDDLIRTISTKPVGTVVTLDIVRDEAPLQVQVTLAKKPSEAELAANTPSGKQTNAVKKFGITVGSISAANAQHLGLQSPGGVVIIDVDPGSRADWGGLEQDDVICEINRQRVQSVDDWNSMVKSLDDNAVLMFTIVRGGRTYFVTLESLSEK